MCFTTRSATLIPDSQRIYLAQAFSFNHLTPAGFLALPLLEQAVFVFYGRSDNRGLAVPFVSAHCSLACECCRHTCYAWLAWESGIL